MGLSQRELRNLPKDEYESRLAKAYEALYNAGAHYVVDGLVDTPPLIDEINARLARGERP